MSISRTLENFLKDKHIHFNIVKHPRTISSLKVAESAHISGENVMKSVVMEDDEGYVIVVVPSTHRIDLGKIHNQTRRMLGLATESELADIFKDCEAGAIPATGEPYGLETFWDDSLSEKKDIYFEAGNHEELVHMTREEYLKLVEEKTHGIFSHHL